MLVAIPDANQTFRELTFEVISKRIESDIQPAGVLSGLSRLGPVRPGRARPGQSRAGRICWSPSTDEASGTRTIYLARRGPDGHQPCRAAGRPGPGGRQPVLDRQGRPGRHLPFPGALILALNPDPVFPDINIQRGLNEKTIPELAGRHARTRSRTASRRIPKSSRSSRSSRFRWPAWSSRWLAWRWGCRWPATASWPASSSGSRSSSPTTSCSCWPNR